VKKSLALDRIRARALASENSVNLRIIYDVIQNLEISQRELSRSLIDVRRMQGNQMGAADNLQLVSAYFSRVHYIMRDLNVMCVIEIRSSTVDECTGARGIAHFYEGTNGCKEEVYRSFYYSEEA
jgi:hypothetical protein